MKYRLIHTSISSHFETIVSILSFLCKIDIMSTKQYFLVVIVVVISLLIAFYSGYFVKAKVNTSNLKPYFSDEIILITKEKPHLTLIAYSSRRSQDNQTYSHRQKAFFFDGQEWKSRLSNADSNNKDITPTETIPNWEITIDPSLVLKQAIKGEVQIDNNNIKFDVPVINNEMGIRSLENYTLFRSESTGTLTIDGKAYESYVLYTRIYSYATAINQITVTDP